MWALPTKKKDFPAFFWKKESFPMVWRCPSGFWDFWHNKHTLLRRNRNKENQYQCQRPEGPLENPCRVGTAHQKKPVERNETRQKNRLKN